MKIRTLNILYILLPVVPLMLVNSSCKKNNDAAEPMRMFMPSGDIKATSAETYVTLSWNASLYRQSTDKSITYTVQVSKDSLFNTVERTYVTDTTGVKITQDSILVRKQYYARIKTNSYGNSPESKWFTSSAFKITGEQIFYAIRDAEIKETSVTLRWILTQGLTKVVFTPATGNPIESTISAGEISSGIKVVTGLTGGTAYQVEIFQGTKSKGYLAFTTIAATTYTVIITPADNLATVIDTCSNNAVIGLQPGTYSAGTTNYAVKQKTITIKSVSGNTSDTKVNWKEFTLKGTGAGIKLQDIEFDGLASNGQYLLNVTGLNADADPATLTSIEVTNCVIHNIGTCLLRANRATVIGDHKMGSIKFRNCLVYDNLMTGTSAFTLITLDKLQFTTLDISNSTFYNYGQAFLTAASTLTATPMPIITIDGCTINYGGANTKYVLFDASANPVGFTVQNTIVANCPKTGASVPNLLFRGTSASSTMNFSFNNTFGLSTGGATPAAVLLPTYAYLTAGTNRTIDLGWTATTTDFTLPAGSELRTGGKTGGPIGDPRWAY